MTDGHALAGFGEYRQRPGTLRASGGDAGGDDAPPDKREKRLKLSDLAMIKNALSLYAERTNLEGLAARFRCLERSLPALGTACSLIFDASHGGEEESDEQ